MPPDRRRVSRQDAPEARPLLFAQEFEGEFIDAESSAFSSEARLKIQKQLPEADTLVRELQDFRVEFTPAGHLTFNARSGKHDDLVLALAIAVWRAHGGGMASWGLYEYYRRQALGSAASEPSYYVGFDLG